MTGKQKCKILKQIRRQIAETNDINLLVEECTRKGKCRGTCPRCEWEVRVLERELEKRRLAGKKVALAGISVGFLLSSCSPIDTINDLVSSVSHPLEGDMLAETTSGTVVEEALEEEPTVPETEVELGEAEPVEEAVAEGLLPAEDETETDGALLPDEEIWEVAGGMGPADFAEEETPAETDDFYILEGDVAYIEPEGGEQP